MNLVFYSGGHYHNNRYLNRRALSFIRRRVPRITYIPASSEYGLEDFRDFVDALDSIKKCQFVYFPIDYPYSEEMKQRAFESDMIFLSGGNTYYFLHHLRQTGILDDLHNHAQEGRVLAGLSAGAILMTPNINTAGFPKFDCDDNFVGLKAKRAMKMTQFEFFPHYTHTKRYVDALKDYTRRSRNPVFAIPDESGLVCTERGVEILGTSFLYMKGQCSPITKCQLDHGNSFDFIEKRSHSRYTLF